jgi:hypothetical protein
MTEPTDEQHEEFLKKSQEELQKWEKYVQDQHDVRKQQAAKLQELVDESGLLERGINPLAPEFEDVMKDFEFQKQMSLHYGLKLDQGQPIDTSKPDVSLWRQRTRALKV